MCGIAGYIGQGDTASARAMANVIAHRGPDGTRIEIIRNGRDSPASTLAHTRLSIIDLARGWHPLRAAGSTLIGNGEIYNYVELTDECGLKTGLTTGSDFEPLLHLYAKEGEKAFDRLRGMYAFCLCGCDGRIWLVRDPFGIKPLYYREADGVVQFASEPRALLNGAFDVEDEPLQELLAFNYSVGKKTAFRGVSRLRPGETLEVISGRAVTGKIRPTHTTKSAVRLGEREHLEELDRVLQDSVKVHQRADVPYGLFMSGGIDSSVLATLMARSSPKPVTAFTCGFETSDGTSKVNDERFLAEKVARSLKMDWHDVLFTEEDFWRILPQVANYLDEPTSDYASLPTYKLAEAAKGTLKVVLTGEGSDEIFGGYSRYRRAMRPAIFGGRDSGPQAKVPFLADRGRAAVSRWREDTVPLANGVPYTALQTAQMRDIAGWLPSDLLLKLDRCLMAHGLEGRTPFLDPVVAQYAFNLPDRWKVHGRLGKWLLRRWLERNCPAAKPFASKSGFTVPIEAWIAPRAERLARTVADVEGVRRYCDTESVRAVFKEDRSRFQWPLLFFAVWWGIHIERLSPSDALTRLM